MTMRTLLESTILVLAVVALALQLLQLALLAIGVIARRRARWQSAGFDPRDAYRSQLAPSVTLLAPAWNEASSIETSVTALLAVPYPALSCVVVNDGSSDNTLAVLQQAFALELIAPDATPRSDTAAGHGLLRGRYRSRRDPRLWVLDQANAGKAAALNLGLAHAPGALVCMIDADTLLAPDAIARLVDAFEADPTLVAAGGALRVANGHVANHGRLGASHRARGWIERAQAVEYARVFSLARTAWNLLGGDVLVSGAFGMFRRDVVREAGGYLTTTVGEDMELVVRLRAPRPRESGDGPTVPERPARRVCFVPESVAWTEVPRTARALAGQRDRWARGLVDVLRRHRHHLAAPGSGTLGWIALPYVVAVEAVAPIIEVVGLLALLLGTVLGLDLSTPLTAWAISIGLAVCGSLLAIAASPEGSPWTRGHDQPEGHQSSLTVDLLLEAVCYRPFVAWCRTRGLWRGVRGVDGWGAVPRDGFSPSPQAAGLLLVVAASLLPRAGQAQPRDPFTRVGVQLEETQAGRATQHAVAVSLERVASAMQSWRVAVRQQSRFTRTETAVSAELARHHAGHGGYALRASTSPGAVQLPRLAIGVDRSLVRGQWVATGSLDVRQWAALTLIQPTVQLERYVNAERLALMVTMAPRRGSAPAGAVRAVWGHDWRGGTTELGVALGREWERFPEGWQRPRTRAVSLRQQLGKRPRWSVLLAHERHEPGWSGVTMGLGVVR